MVLNKLQKLFIIFLFFIIIVTICFVLFLNYQEIKNQSSQVDVKINNHLIKANISNTQEQRYRGLSNRKSLCADCGMLFIFPEKDLRKFVMRNMNFPLDIIFISDNKIINIEQKLKPEGSQPQNIYSSISPANMVLELNATYCEKNNIKVGDKIIIKNKNLIKN